MKRAIVTGATGFIGSWLVQELIYSGYEVVVIVRNINKLIPDIISSPSCFIIEKDIYNLTESDFECEKSYDIFYHLAWSGVSPECKNESEKQMRNISMSLNALDVCNSIGCKLFVASGTVAEYALTDDIMNLNLKQSPNDMYGATKVSVHYFLEVRARQLNQPFIWTVIPSTFGERRTDNNIITYTIRTLLKGEKPLYGNLNQMWDFLYVAEVVRALRLIGEKGIVGKVYGIGSGEYRPLKDYIIQIRNIINPSLELGIGELSSMSKQTFSSCVNIYDLIRDTGFKPLIGFDEGIKKTIDYLSK